MGSAVDRFAVIFSFFGKKKYELRSLVPLIFFFFYPFPYFCLFLMENSIIFSNPSHKYFEDLENIPYNIVWPLKPLWPPVYKRQVSPRRGGGNDRTFAFWGRILVLSPVFLVFLEVFCIFFMYSCSKSFRELKSAIKNQFFLYLGGLGAKLSF